MGGGDFRTGDANECAVFALRTSRDDRNYPDLLPRARNLRIFASAKRRSALVVRGMGGPCSCHNVQVICGQLCARDVGIGHRLRGPHSKRTSIKALLVGGPTRGLDCRTVACAYVSASWDGVSQCLFIL